VRSLSGIKIQRDGSSKEQWYLYIAECRDKTLYVGIAKDVARRIKEHNTESRCRYTRYRKPVRLVYQELCVDYGAARERESEVKKFSRKKKLGLMMGKM